MNGIKVKPKDIITVNDDELLCIIVKNKFLGLDNIQHTGKMVVLKREEALKISLFKDDVLKFCFVNEDSIKGL